MAAGDRSTGRLTSRWLALMRARRFDILLGAMLLLLLSTPVVRLVADLGSPMLAHVTVNLVYGLILVSAVFAVCQTRRSLVIAAVLALPAFLLHEIRVVLGVDALLGAGHVFSVCFLGYTIYVLLRHIFSVDRVTLNTICAALCVYLLISLVWANFYSLTAIVEPKAFAINVAERDEAEGEAMRLDGTGTIYPVYFSLVTLTTLGYGDIVPVGDAARMLAAVEAVVGQLYLAVLVARLVGLHISQSSKTSDSSDRGNEEP
jgi:hypothetical protein